MIRVLLILITVMALSTALSLFGNVGGSVDAEWLGYRVHSTVPFAVAALFFMFALLVLAFKALHAALFWGERVERYRASRLVSGLLQWNAALEAGDASVLRRPAKLFSSLFTERYPADALLTEARASLERGETDEARAIYAGLTGSRRLAGLKGLADVAKLDGDRKALAAAAEEAVRLRPDLAWPRVILRDVARSARDREGLAEHLKHLRTKTAGVAAARYRRESAAALILWADDLWMQDKRGKAAKTAAEGFALAKDDRVIRLGYAQFLAKAGETAALDQLLRDGWAASPCYAGGMLMLDAMRDASERERLRAAEGLYSRAPEAPASMLIKATALFRSGHTASAKETAERAVTAKPCREAYALLAELEEAGAADQFVISEYRRLAAEAPELAEKYVCTECGSSSRLPSLQCGVCRAVDSYEAAA